MYISRSTQHYLKYKMGVGFPLIKFKQTNFNFETTTTTPPEKAIQWWIQGREGPAGHRHALLLFLDQSEVQGPPVPHTLSEGLDPSLK